MASTVCVWRGREGRGGGGKFYGITKTKTVTRLFSYSVNVERLVSYPDYCSLSGYETRHTLARLQTYTGSCLVEPSVSQSSSHHCSHLAFPLPRLLHHSPLPPPPPLQWDSGEGRHIHEGRWRYHDSQHGLRYQDTLTKTVPTGHHLSR